MRAISRFDDAAFFDELKAARDKKRKLVGGAEVLFARLAHAARAGAGVGPHEFERFMGRDDLLPTSYLERGLMASRAVCRISVSDPVGTSIEWGTGFLISPRLLLTNNHIIATPGEAARATIEFNYELDPEGRTRRATPFRLDPGEAFLTSPRDQLDFTIVAVHPASDDGAVRLSDFGFLRLDADASKVEAGEFATIVQHPGSAPKKVSLRENQIVKLGDQTNAAQNNFIWYSSDTAPGSSGAPVFSDAWQVIALHHASVPAKRRSAAGGEEYQLTNGHWLATAQAEALPDDQVRWLANEGVRVSRLVATASDLLKAAGAAAPALIRTWLDDAQNIRPFPEAPTGGSVIGRPLIAPPATPAIVPATFERSGATPRPRVRDASEFAGRRGYDPKFLATEVALPGVARAAQSDVARVAGSSDDVLRYMHYSVIFNATRKIAFVSAVNIDGRRWAGLERDTDKWAFDGRIDLDIQIDDAFYGNEPDVPGAKNKNWFDRGHLTRRQDPLWGDFDTVTTANEDTFMWTNCSPQYWGFNEGFGGHDNPNPKSKRMWSGLEEFVLQNVKTEAARASVFNGPILYDDDEEHRGVKVPRFYFKIVATQNTDGQLVSSGYVVSQERWATNIPFERLPIGPNSTTENFQTPIAWIAEQTGLAFDPALVAADAYPTGPRRPLESFRDIVHPTK
jgi:endonuclease G, mitochondrial